MDKLNMEEIIKQYKNININYDTMYSEEGDITFIMRNVTVNNGCHKCCTTCYWGDCPESFCQFENCGSKRYEEVCGWHFGKPDDNTLKSVGELVAEFEF